MRPLLCVIEKKRKYMSGANACYIITFELLWLMHDCPDMTVL